MAEQEIVDYRELMKLTSAQVDRPKAAPECHLVGTLGKYEIQTTRGESQNRVLVVPIMDLSAANPESAAKLEGFDMAKLRSPYRNALTAEFWLTPRAFYMFADAVDRVVGSPNLPVDQRTEQLLGARVMFRITPALDKEGKDTGQNQVDTRTLMKYEPVVA